MVDEDSAVIDGSQKIGFEKKHRDLKRFASRDEEDYQDILRFIRDWITIVEQKERGTREPLKSCRIANLHVADYQRTIARQEAKMREETQLERGYKYLPTR